MVVGLTKLSDSEIAGSSSGKPPACSTPRLTSSTRCLKWVAGLMSDQVLRMAMTGLPFPVRWRRSPSAWRASGGRRSAGRPARTSARCEDHTALVDAIEQGDGALAQEVLRRHLSGTLSNIDEIRNRHPSFVR
jgi:hypothetical protein